MSKIVSTKTNAIFLAAILIAGTIAAISQSFIIGAQAQEYYGMERDYKKLDKKDVSVKSIKCNNVNVNVNGLELNVLPPSLDSLLSSGDEGERGAASYGSGGQSGYDNNSFKFICINNNNNTVIGGEEVPEIPEIPELCEECFGANSALQTELLDFLVEFEGRLGFSISTTDGVREIREAFEIGPETDTIEQLCAQIENSAEELGVPLSDELIDFVFSAILAVDPEAPNSGIDALIECLVEAGIIVDRELPPLMSISGNGIAGVNVECTGNPLCARLQ